jgi:hypothetical protein
VRGELVEHRHHQVGQALVLPNVTTDDAQPRAQLPGPSGGHPAAHSEALGLVGGGQHHPAADGDGQAAQRWVE